MVLLRDAQSDPYHDDIPAYDTRRGSAQECASPPTSYYGAAPDAIDFRCHMASDEDREDREDRNF